MNRRGYVRHPADVPIIVGREPVDDPAAANEMLRDIGHGGLSFRSDTPFREGTVLVVRIPAVDPVFMIHACVAWCAQSDDRFDVGVAFVEPDKVFQARMIEQVCQIEHYRKEVLAREGRCLTGQEAALEWIGKYAAEFPEMGEPSDD